MNDEAKEVRGTGPVAEARPEYSADAPKPAVSERPRLPMTAVCWYSFKGGVGRSMSLANVCALLARDGYQVGVLDLDIEAPGLHTISPFKTNKYRPTGVLGFLSDLVQERTSVSSLDQYGCAVEIQGGREAFFLPAGPPDHEEYLKLLYQVREAGLFAPKASQGPFYLDQIKLWFREEKKAEFLLIDARTGYSEMGGVGTLLLADLIVLVAGLNENNLSGLVGAYGQIKKRLSHDPASPVGIIPVATIVSSGETEWCHASLAAAELMLAQSGPLIRVPPWGGAAFRAGAVVLEDWRPDDLCAAYRELAGRIVAFAKERRQREEPKPQEPSDQERRLAAAKALLDERPEDPLAHCGYGDLLFLAGQWREGLAELRKAAELAPNEFYILDRLAARLVEVGETQDAYQTYRKLVALADRQPYTVQRRTAVRSAFYAFLSAERSNVEGDFRTAEAECEAALERFFPKVEKAEDIPAGAETAHADLQRTLGRCLDLLGQKEAAAEIFAAAARVHPDNIQVYQDYKRFLERGERWDELERLAQGAFIRGFAPETTLGWYVDALIQNHKEQEALAFLGNLEAQGHRPAVVSLLFGRVMQRLGMWQQAVSRYREAVQIDPWMRQAWVEWCTELHGRSSLKDALVVATELVNRFGGDLWGRLIRAECLSDLGRYRDAIPDVRAVLEGGGTLTILFLEKSRVAAQAVGDGDLAERCHRLLLDQPSLDKKTRARSLTWYSWFLAMTHPDRHEEARQAMEEAIRIAPQLPLVRAGAALMALSEAKAVGPDQLPDLRLPQLTDLAMEEGKALSVRKETGLWEVLGRIWRCDGADALTRWAAGSTLAKSLLEGGEYERGRELIVALEAAGVPEGLGPVLTDLKLTLYGGKPPSQAEPGAQLHAPLDESTDQ
jgi:tetratricopeptide (TPR) repeat protein